MLMSQEAWQMQSLRELQKYAWKKQQYTEYMNANFKRLKDWHEELCHRVIPMSQSLIIKFIYSLIHLFV